VLATHAKRQPIPINSAHCLRANCVMAFLLLNGLQRYPYTAAIP
jgi:hypothetical protein